MYSKHSLKKGCEHLYRSLEIFDEKPCKLFKLLEIRLMLIIVKSIMTVYQTNFQDSRVQIHIWLMQKEQKKNTKLSSSSSKEI